MNIEKAADTISKIIIEAVKSETSMHQPLVDAIVEVLNLYNNGRCVLYSIDDKCIKGIDMFCEITAAYPNSEKEHGLRKKESIEDMRHADLKEVIRIAGLMHIKDPATNNVTAGFRDHVANKNITEIVYLPIISKDRRKRILGIIVIDEIYGRRFSEAEIDFCEKIGSSINTNIQFVENFLMYT